MAEFLRRAPFHLDDAALGWVTATLARLTPEEKVGQLFNFLVMGDDPDLDKLHALKPGGITRAFGRDLETEVRLMERLHAGSSLPLLVSADLEGSLMSLAFGTEVPNPLALAAIDDVEITRDMSRLLAEEASALGVNWSFTPVLDINAAFRSPIVATRGFGSDPDRIARHALAAIEGFQSAGLAATAKHWPGEGHDDRDQHLVTTAIPLGVEEWEATHGRLYRAAIAAGVKSVMSAHIAFPAYVRQQETGAGLEAYRPASVSRRLNMDLLRERLGFNGLIVSDATPMAGFGAFGKRSDMLPEVIENGCDVILFSSHPAEDVQVIRAAVANGRISAGRLNDALLRILGLKASLGLHNRTGTPFRTAADRLRRPEAVARAKAAVERAPTLVKDVNGLLPLSPARHRRVLLVSGGIVMPFVPHPLPLAFGQMLRAAGFDVTEHRPGAEIDPAAHDLVLFAIAEETLLTRGRIFLDWNRLLGGFEPAMQRIWHDVPTALVSFGYPYLLYDAPRMPCVINAYTALPSMQQAVVDGLVGKIRFNRTSPVDPFCGLEDARW